MADIWPSRKLKTWPIRWVVAGAACSARARQVDYGQDPVTGFEQGLGLGSASEVLEPVAQEASQRFAASDLSAHQVGHAADHPPLDVLGVAREHGLEVAVVERVESATDQVHVLLRHRGRVCREAGIVRPVRARAAGLDALRGRGGDRQRDGHGHDPPAQAGGVAGGGLGHDQRRDRRPDQGHLQPSGGRSRRGGARRSAGAGPTGRGGRWPAPPPCHRARPPCRPAGRRP